MIVFDRDGEKSAGGLKKRRDGCWMARYRAACGLETDRLENNEGSLKLVTAWAVKERRGGPGRSGCGDQD